MGMSDKKTPLRIAFGENIRNKRKGLGFSQIKLAEMSGLHHTYTSSVERGERNISLENICILAKALGCQINELFEGLEEMPVKQKCSPGPIDRLQNIEMQLEILTETIKEIARGRN